MTAVINRTILTTVLAAAIAIWPFAGPIATAQPADDPEGTLVEELVISSNLGGPAFWKVSDGDTTIYVLGVPGALPKGTGWDERRLAMRLEGAKALILPPRIKARPVVMTAYLLTNQKKFQGGPPVDGALAARLERNRAALKVKPQTLAKWKPGVQGMILAGELQKPLKLDDGQPEGRILALARKAKVKQVRAGTAIDPMPALKSLVDLDAAGQRICLEDALDQVEAGRGPLREASAGWARGDVKSALRAQRGFERCLARLPMLSALSRKAMGDTSSTIARQMAVPGKAVAVVDLRQLLARGGVLDQLRARGFKIDTPASAG
ncbi:MAG: GumN family protein [Caulobacter sp.]|nr:GumN family protein [Caulobacter sp.]